MRLYSPAKLSSPVGEDGEGRHEDTTTTNTNNNNNNNNTTDPTCHHYEPRQQQQQQHLPSSSSPSSQQHHNHHHHQHQRTPLENDSRGLDNNTTNNNTKLLQGKGGDDINKTQQLTRLDDTLHINTHQTSTRGSPTPRKTAATTTTTHPEMNGTQNGSNAIPLSPPPPPTPCMENGTGVMDTVRSLDSVPWNLEGIETIKENGCCRLREWSLSSASDDHHTLSDEDELSQLREENKRLKVALKEAADVNSEWREYHQQRQQYIHRLVNTIHELQHPRSPAQSPRQLEVDGSGGGGEDEVRRLRGAVARLQADHDEHVTLLEMQVRAHRDDWEAERSEKQATQTALAEAQARTALLLQELQLTQAKLADSESKRGVCWRCGAGVVVGSNRKNGSTPRNNSSSNPPSAPHSLQASPVPAPSPAPSGVSPTPLQDQPQAPLKGWIPVSMLHQIAFSGTTPEHQSPVVQAHSRPTSLNTHTPSPRTSTTPTREPISINDDKRRYEAMGARPKVALGTGKGRGMVEEVVRGLEEAGAEGTGKGLGSVEDESTAKHRARSILASAIPVSPVSSGPAPSFPTTLAKSPSAPVIAKGYVPITSTVLTPVNFRPPFVAHKRPSAIKQAALQAQQQSDSPVSTPNTHTINKTISGNNARSISDDKTSNLQQRSGAVKEGKTNKSGSSKSRSSMGGSKAAGGRGNKGSQIECITTPTTTVTSSSPTLTPTTTTTTSTTTATRTVHSQDNPVPVLAQPTPIPNQPSSTPQTSTDGRSSSISGVKGINVTDVKGGNKTRECEGRGGKIPPLTESPVTSPPPAATATTAFASITVTTTAAGVNAPPSASSYSSTTSSRSSSPGMSLTTFGLNSEGRGIPGAIFFAMGSDQRNNGRSPQPTPVSVGVKSPTPDSVVNKDSRPPSGIKSPPVSVNSSSNGNVGIVKQEHWWSVEGSGGEKQSGGKLVNSTWVRLMGGQASTKAGSGLPWRTARAVSGQQLDQARRASHDDPSNGATTATFTCTPAVNSPASSTLSSAASSGASSPLPCPTSVPNHELKSLASKNISSAIMSYELGSKCEVSNTTMGSDGVATLTRRDLVCPSCQMLFPPDKHVNFLDHFEACRGPEYADL
ncbi:hypothetical protein Pmani_005039 [Petrolisthes manimaculis]|uniref:Uncharacterized protein n=1 Tax=Petrolisthes manimaculis TaxID=1843537 RepID=A0AAE1QD96_9EUCA|nr:hypothetical protein Pmani_005039 [Petrolisthes manimaculis]